MNWLFLDHWIFGNGHGMKSPFCDNKFYWLNGRIYTWIGGLGAQLSSHEWRIPKPGTQRVLNKRRYTVFGARSKWFRKEVSWAVVDLPENLYEAPAFIRKIKSELDRL